MLIVEAWSMEFCRAMLSVDYLALKQHYTIVSEQVKVRLNRASARGTDSVLYCSFQCKLMSVLLLVSRSHYLQVPILICISLHSHSAGVVERSQPIHTYSSALFLLCTLASLSSCSFSRFLRETGAITMQRLNMFNAPSEGTNPHTYLPPTTRTYLNRY